MNYRNSSNVLFNHIYTPAQLMIFFFITYYNHPICKFAIYIKVLIYLGGSIFIKKINVDLGV